MRARIDKIEPGIRNKPHWYTRRIGGINPVLVKLLHSPQAKHIHALLKYQDLDCSKFNIFENLNGKCRNLTLILLKYSRIK